MTERAAYFFIFMGLYFSCIFDTVHWCHFPLSVSRKNTSAIQLSIKTDNMVNLVSPTVARFSLIFFTIITIMFVCCCFIKWHGCVYYDFGQKQLAFHNLRGLPVWNQFSSWQWILKVFQEYVLNSGLLKLNTLFTWCEGGGRKVKVSELLLARLIGISTTSL